MVSGSHFLQNSFQAARNGKPDDAGGIDPDTKPDQTKDGGAKIEELVKVGDDTEENGDEMEGLLEMPVRKTRVLRIPGMSMDQASKNPTLKNDFCTVNQVYRKNGQNRCDNLETI